MRYSTFTAIAALASTMLVGAMIAADNDRNTQPLGGLDPTIIEILQRAEAGTLPDRFPAKAKNGLRPRALNRSKKPDIGIRRDDTRLQIKFADELQVRIKDDGTVISRTNRSISNITSIIEDFELILTPAIRASEERIDALMARARLHSRKQTPDIGGMYWVDGPTSAVSAAADVFHGMDDVEWVFWNTIMDPTKHTSSRPSIFSPLARQESDAMLAAAKQQMDITGACLIGDRTCEPDVTVDVCNALAGTYLGDASVCRTNENAELLLPAGACCVSLLTNAATNPAFTGVLAVVGCLDNENDGMTFAVCLTINAGAVFSGIGVLNTHMNGVWFDEEDCDGITTDCGPPVPGAFICGDLNDPATVFSGDCYVNQFDPAQTWVNRFLTAGGLPGTPGCWDAPGYPFIAPTPATTGTAGDAQGCCDAIDALDPNCMTNGGWDDICASYANSPQFSGFCLNQRGFTLGVCPLRGISGDCTSPWGNNHRHEVDQQFPLVGTQPMMTVSTGGTLALRTVPHPDGITTCAYGCGWDFAGTTSVPGVPVFPIPPFAPPPSNTPDFGSEPAAGLGLIQHMTDEPIIGTVDPGVAFGLGSPVLDPALLAWPLGGAQVGVIGGNTVYAATNNPIAPGLFGLPVDPLGPRSGDARWWGTGLSLFADFLAPSGLGNGNIYSGLYGLGFRKQDETGVANGTHGAGVKVAVLDYSAFVQTYSDTTGTPLGGIHEDLSLDSNGDGIPDVGVLLEGTMTGHTPLQMIFNPPDTNDYPFDFPQSPNHGTAQLGVIAASWGTVGAEATNVPANGTPPTTGTNFGAMGIAPQATTAFFPLMDNDQTGGGGTGGRVETAWFNAMEWLGFGDVLSAGYVSLSGPVNTYPNIAFNPSVHSLIETAVSLGISVVIEAGDAGLPLDSFDYPNDIDPGAIVVAAVTPGGSGLLPVPGTNVPGSPMKRWADSLTASNFCEAILDTTRITCSAWGMGVVTCGMGPAQDNLLGFNTITYGASLVANTNPVTVQSRSYTNNYHGTSAAAAIVAGCVASVQGYCRQVYSTPLGPLIMRHYMAHGQFLGNDPDTGAPLLSFINAAETNTNVIRGTDHNFDTTDWPTTPTLSFDISVVDPGEGNIVGYFVDPRYACLRTTVDPLFDHPNIDSIMVLRGTLLEGNINAIASQDGVLYGVNPEYTTAGEYGVPASVPGGSVIYNLYGEVTDTYLTGVATDPRGDPLLSLHRMTWQLALSALQANTLMKVWMWDYDKGRWVQPSVSILAAEGTNVAEFDIIRSGSLLDSNGTYHARFVTFTGSGPPSRVPHYYDQIRLIPTIPGTQP